MVIVSIFIFVISRSYCDKFFGDSSICISGSGERFLLTFAFAIFYALMAFISIAICLTELYLKSF